MPNPTREEIDEFLHKLDDLENSAFDYVAQVSRMEGAVAVHEDPDPQVVSAALSVVMEQMDTLVKATADLVESCIPILPDHRKEYIQDLIRKIRADQRGE